MTAQDEPERRGDLLPAGPFAAWWRATIEAIDGRRDADVPCDGCTACCRSSQFVHIGPDETATLARIPNALLFPAPRMPKGHVLLGYDEHGRCPMLTDDGCSIYEHRPRTCRTYDCRVFAAAGIDADENKPAIGERSRRWRFTHPTDEDRRLHDLVRAAARAVEGEAPPTRTALAVRAVRSVAASPPEPPHRGDTLSGMRTIDVYADVACPFTHVGLRRFVERRAAEGRTEPVLRVHAWPLELVNGSPLDPHHIGDEVVAIRAQVAPDLFAGFRAEAFPSTSMPAFRLAAAAYAVSDEIGEAVSLALRDAIFERGLDVTDPAVLAAIAGSHGVGTAADEQVVLDDYAGGRERGVIGSPHFFAGDDGRFCPLLHITKVDGGWHITQDLSVLDDLLA